MSKKILTSFQNDEYIITCQQQKIVVPSTLMARFVAAAQLAYIRQIRQIRTLQKQSEEKTKKLVAEAHHPDVLPFTEDKPRESYVLPSHPEPQPPPPKKLKKRKGEPEPPPFKHTKFT